MLISKPIKCLQTPNIGLSALAVSDNGNKLAAGDLDGNLFLYYNYNLIKKFCDHKNYIITLQFSKAGNYLASGAADKCLILINLTNQEFKVKTFSDNSSHIMKVGFNENEFYLITASSDKTLQIYNTKTNQKIQKIAYNCSLNFADFFGFNQIILFGTQRQVEILNFNTLHKK